MDMFDSIINALMEISTDEIFETDTRTEAGNLLDWTLNFQNALIAEIVT